MFFFGRVCEEMKKIPCKLFFCFVIVLIDFYCLVGDMCSNLDHRIKLCLMLVPNKWCDTNSCITPHY